jgi:hypothetical protein
MTAAVLRFEQPPKGFQPPYNPVDNLFSDVVICTLPDDHREQERWGELSVSVDEHNPEIVWLAVSSEGATVHVELTHAQATALGSALS